MTTTAPVAPRTTARRVRRGLALTITAAAAFGVAGVGMAGSASAAGPNVLSSAGQNVEFPTWVFGTTTVCATNLSSYSYGTASVRTWFSSPSTFVIQPRSTHCLTGAWGGVPINVANSGPTALSVYSY